MRLSLSTPLSKPAAALDAQILGDASLLIEAIETDSRRAGAGVLFAAQPGEEMYARDAVDRGARAVVMGFRDFEASTSDLRAHLRQRNVSVLLVDSVAQALGKLGRMFTDDAATKLRLIGITGTNGKTTTAEFLTSILTFSDVKVARIGTLGALLPSGDVATGYTTPPTLELHELLARAYDDGARAVVMEVSSHALALDRVAGLAYECAVLTNITQDHLDFHGTLEAYIAAKEKLFAGAGMSVLNIDDPAGARFAETYDGLRYAIDRDADIRAIDIRTSAEGSTFSVDGTVMSLAVPGRFNVANALAAIAAARAYGVADPYIAAGLARVSSVPGRMERLGNRRCSVIVDFAHTPDALSRVLHALRETRPSRLTVVFGCGGDRDRVKRPLMGAIAERAADRVILTSDNPRSEDAEAIVADIAAGMQRRPEIILDRAQAIECAIAESHEGETIVIAGKGAERDQIIGREHIAFDDATVVRAALARYEAQIV